MNLPLVRLGGGCREGEEAKLTSVLGDVDEREFGILGNRESKGEGAVLFLLDAHLEVGHEVCSQEECGGYTALPDVLLNVCLGVEVRDMAKST